MCACCMLLDELLVWCRVHVHAVVCFTAVEHFREGDWHRLCETFSTRWPGVAIHRGSAATGGARGGAASPACVRKGTFPLAPLYLSLLAYVECHRGAQCSAL